MSHPATPHIHQLVDHLFRHESGKMIAVLTRLLGLERMNTAEDIVQDTLLQAMTTWSYAGIPDRPEAWLYQVAKNKAIDYLRRQKKAPAVNDAFVARYQMASDVLLEELFLEHEIADSQLRMMFACCHPSIPVTSQVAFILRTLCGLSTAEIARAFLSPEETIAKRIYRAKEKLYADKIQLDFPDTSAIEANVDAVLKSLYLLFNEGYYSSHPDQLIREDLCREAMRLCHLLTEHPRTAFSHTKALLSLMCFQSSRLLARQGDQNTMVLLKYQDRTRWYKPLIFQGFEYLEQAAEPAVMSTYHLEAVIASIHARAASFEQTDWSSIYYVYDLLYQLQPNPIVAMNKAIASGYAIGFDHALQSLQQIEGLEQHHLYFAALGDISMEMNQPVAAKDYFEKALSLTSSTAEQQLLREKISRCC